MNIDKKTLLKLAHLARVEIDPADEKSLIKDMQQILTWMEKLGELDTSSIESSLHMSPEKNVFREDEGKNLLTTEESLKNAPQKAGPFFKVPKVLD